MPYNVWGVLEKMPLIPPDLLTSHETFMGVKNLSTLEISSHSTYKLQLSFCMLLIYPEFPRNIRTVSIEGRLRCVLFKTLSWIHHFGEWCCQWQWPCVSVIPSSVCVRARAAWALPRAVAHVYFIASHRARGLNICLLKDRFFFFFSVLFCFFLFPLF